MRVLAVDPGGTTGFSYWGNDEWQGCWSSTFDHVHAEFKFWIKDIDVLVMESFHISTHTAKKSQHGMQSIELIGVGRFLCKEYGTFFNLQAPSEAKLFVDDAKLKALDMWTAGPDHARDATRHLILYLAKTHNLKPDEIRKALDAS